MNAHGVCAQVIEAHSNNKNPSIKFASTKREGEREDLVECASERNHKITVELSLPITTCSRL